MTKTLSQPLGYVAILTTVVCWAVFLVSMRAAMLSPLGVAEIGVIRFVTSALIFLPVLLRSGPVPGAVPLWQAIVIGTLGGGFFLTVMAFGASYAPAADAGVFAPSTLPVFVAILSAIILGEKFTGFRYAGLALVLIGAAAVGGWEAVANAEEGAWRGHALFLCASFGWAVYTVVFRQSGMSALEAAAMISFWSALSFIVWGVVAGLDYSGVGWGEILWQMFAQGVLAGAVALFGYGFAAQAIGPSQAAAFAALTPILTAVGAATFLGESITAWKWLGIIVVATGVVLASGVLDRKGT